jgi:hypothetical protein
MISGAPSDVFGWMARWSALALAGFCVAAAVLFHWNFADQMQTINFMKNLTIAGGVATPLRARRRTVERGRALKLRSERRARGSVKLVASAVGEA